MREELGGYIDRPATFLARYIALHPVRHACIFGCISAAVAFSVGTQYGIKKLVDSLTGPAGSSAVWAALMFLVALIAADNLLWRVAAWVGHATFVAVTGDIRKDLFGHLTGHAPAYFASRAVGSVTSRISAAANAAYTIENMLAWNVIPPCLATLFAVAFLANVDLTMALALVVVAVIILLGMLYLAMAGQRLHRSFAERAASVDGELTDVVGNILLVKAFGGVGRELERFDRTLEGELTARRASLFYLERVRIAHATVTIALTVFMLAWAVELWRRGAITAGDVILVSTLGLSILHATRDLAVALVDTTQHIARFSEALSALVAPYDIKDHPQAVPLPATGTTITFDRVGFTYPHGRRLFHDLEFEIPKGQRVALIGPSGSGKSTIFCLLQRFYDVEDGRILLNGQDIRWVTELSLRNAIAVVPQDLSLFNRSLAENIRYARPDASLEDVIRAADLAGCREFIERLPHGLATIVGNRGVALSGGEKQRIAIARAFLKDAPLVLLDEATSSLDPAAEAAVKSALGRLMQGRTVIAIAHRLATIRDFDRVLVLESGRLIEDGSPAELLRRESRYGRLVAAESGRQPADARLEAAR